VHLACDLEVMHHMVKHSETIMHSYLACDLEVRTKSLAKRHHRLHTEAVGAAGGLVSVCMGMWKVHAAWQWISKLN
jgi:hypothetical protein